MNKVIDYQTFSGFGIDLIKAFSNDYIDDAINSNTNQKYKDGWSWLIDCFQTDIGRVNFKENYKYCLDQHYIDSNLAFYDCFNKDNQFFTYQHLAGPMFMLYIPNQSIGVEEGYFYSYDRAESTLLQAIGCCIDNSNPIIGEMRNRGMIRSYLQSYFDKVNPVELTSISKVTHFSD